MDGWMDGWMDGCMDGCMDGWMDGWIIDRQIDQWINVTMTVQTHLLSSLVMAERSSIDATLFYKTEMCQYKHMTVT